MAVTQADLQDFHHFASERIANGGADLSLSAIVAQWDARREREESIRDIEEGVQDEKAGRMRPISKVAQEFRDKSGMSK